MADEDPILSDTAEETPKPEPKPEHPGLGDVVLIRIGANTHKAIVLSSRDGEESHLGADGEPMLHLLFIAPEREPNKALENGKPRVGYLPTSFIEYDVVHASHAFSDEFRVEQGLVTAAQISTARGQAEWDYV